MKPIYKILLVVFILNTVYGCEKELKIKSPAVQPKIVLNGVVSADSLISIYVSKSFSYAEGGSKAGILSGASLKLYINNRFVEDMYAGEMNKRVVFKSTVCPKAGDHVRIEAFAAGLNPVWAEIKIPEPVFIDFVATVF